MTGRAAEVLSWIAANASEEERGKLARYGIPQENAVGIAMRDMKGYAQALGRDHALALALWGAGGYEARTIAAFIADPARMSGAEMDRWAEEFDSWAICDTVCFRLFDQCAPAWACVGRWAKSERLFVRRAAFALIWALALHDKGTDDAPYEEALGLIEGTGTLEEPLVEKAMVMAAKAIARRNSGLEAITAKMAARLVASDARNRASLGRKILKSI